MKRDGWFRDPCRSESGTARAEGSGRAVFRSILARDSSRNGSKVGPVPCHLSGERCGNGRFFLPFRPGAVLARYVAQHVGPRTERRTARVDPGRNGPVTGGVLSNFALKTHASPRWPSCQNICRVFTHKKFLRQPTSHFLITPLRVLVPFVFDELIR